MEELTVTRFISAPPDEVWAVMADRMEEWWCPAPWRAEVVVQERRPGGRSAITMHGPDGEIIENEGIFLAWDEGRRFVVTDAVDSGFRPREPFMVGVWEIAAEEEGTRYTASARHWTAQARQEHEEMGFLEGWTTCANQLAALCGDDS